MNEKTLDQREALYATGKWGKALQPERAKSYMEEVSESRQYMENHQGTSKLIATLKANREPLVTGSAVVPNDIFNGLVRSANRYELLRTLNPRQFQVLWDRCLERDLKFDDVVDEMMGEKA